MIKVGDTVEWDGFWQDYFDIPPYQGTVIHIEDDFVVIKNPRVVVPNNPLLIKHIREIRVK